RRIFPPREPANRKVHRRARRVTAQGPSECALQRPPLGFLASRCRILARIAAPAAPAPSTAGPEHRSRSASLRGCFGTHFAPSDQVPEILAGRDRPPPSTLPV